MKKQLVTLDNLDEFICRSGGTMYIDSSMILTAGAKDELNKRGVSIIYGPCPDTATCPEAGHGHVPASTLAGCLSTVCADGTGTELERLLVGMAAILKTEYGITDPDELRKLSLKAARTIQENI